MGKRDIEYYKRFASDAKYIKQYSTASNAATGSKFDSNANVDTKNVATLDGEMHKGDNIGINRYRMIEKITEMFGEDLAKEYIRQLEDHEIYRHDETHPIFPYTYSAKEAIIVKINGKIELCSFEDLYAMSEFEEYLCDEEKEVYCKYPTNIEIRDKNGKWTNITRLVKKKRHRDLVICKTANGESVIVTDNHPMIISDDKSDTIDAIKAEGRLQYRDNKASELVKFTADNSIIPIYRDEECGGFGVVRTNNFIQYSNLNATADWKFGYFIGFFIAEGWYHKSNTTKIDVYDGLILKQKTRPILDKVAQYLYESTGIYSSILKTKDTVGNYALYVKSQSLVKMLLEDFKISPFAQEKKLPMTIFNYPKEFVYGILGGIIDGDGTKRDNGEISIRLSSRTCISQIGAVLSVLDVPFSFTYYDPSKNVETESYINENNYPVFGITFTCPQWLNGISEKYVNVNSKQTFYKRDIWENVETVKKIENKNFLKDNEFIYDITTESNTFILNNIWVHNCVSITLYPFILEGLTTIGGASEAPKNLGSFIGSFINLVFAVAAQFAGAVATPEFLSYMDYFIRQEYGDDYYLRADDVVDLSKKKRTIKKIITDCFEQVVYTLNAPAAARGNQAVFWNLSYFDKTYFDAIFEDFVFPDGTEMQWESVSWLQKLFMKWLNKDRLRKWNTFPVETVNLVYDKETKQYRDPEWADFAAEMWAQGHSFFCYNSDSADSLSSCCRVRNGITENVFSYTLGAGGISTGSKAVITINMNRLVQNAVRDGADISERVREQTIKIHKYLLAWNEMLKELLKDKMLPIYDAGYISLEKQYLTIGCQGLVEAAEFMGIDVSPNEEYYHFAEKLLRPIQEENRKARTKEVMWNCEMVPAENLGVKNAKWDKEDGYVVPRDCYNSYFYRVEDDGLSCIDKMKMHGREMVQFLDGGSANHMNLSEHLSKAQYRQLLDVAAKVGCSYFTYNIPNTICNKCGHISKHYMCHCEECGSEDIDYITRVIGYAKRVSKYSEARQKEAARRYYGKA